ncbi:hypothetical protein C8J57DRAFT_1722207 [Mycena rebaudengoi]|nr:hypothetical protein C8J57DRAFT_1722207 [Mycena rebaudengoi]
MAPSRTSPQISATRRQTCGRRASEARAGKHARAVTRCVVIPSISAYYPGPALFSQRSARPPSTASSASQAIHFHGRRYSPTPAYCLRFPCSATSALPSLYSSSAPCALCSPPRSFMFASPSRCSLSVIHLLDLIRPPPRLPMESYLLSLLSGRCDYCSPSPHTPFSQSYSYAPPLSPQFMHASPFNIYTSSHSRFPFLRSLLHRSTAVSIKYSSTLQGRGSRP